MGDAGEGFPIIFDSSASGYAPISSTNTNLQSSHINLKHNSTLSIQIITDGGAKVNYSYQVTNLPGMPTNWGRTILGSSARDDSYTSAQWSTVQSGSMAANVGVQQGTILTIATTVHLAGRLILSWDVGNTGGTTAKLLACIRSIGYA